MEISPLLLTKIITPEIRNDWIARPQLISRLDQVLHSRLGLVSAPAGYGKTALLTQWILNRSNQPDACHFAWFSLDENDNDPVRFWLYMVAAIRENPGLKKIGFNFLDTIQSIQAPAMQQVLPLLLNELAQAKNKLVLVLDDFHLIENKQIQTSIEFLVDHLPANCHLLIAGRSDPPLPLARYRARRQLLEVRVQDLRFTSQEIIKFFENAAGLRLVPQDLSLIEQNAEGWIAGLQLAALSLEGQPNKLEYLHSFKGDDPYILDFLAEEILSRQSPVTQHFLLVTSILERFNAPFCDFLLKNGPTLFLHGAAAGEGGHFPEFNSNYTQEMEPTDAILNHLDRSNLFLFAIDRQRSWYRYHPLFSNLLQTRLRQLIGEEETAGLHRLAATWLAENQFPLEAFKHARAGGDQDQAYNLYRQNMLGLIMRAQLTTLVSWLEAFPEAFVLSHPETCLGYAWLYLYQVQFDQAEEWSIKAHNCLANHADSQLLIGQVDAIQATVAINRSDFQRSIQLSKQALANLPENISLVRALLFLNLGDCYSLNDEFEQAANAFQNALAAARIIDNHMIEVIIIGSLGELYIHFGKLHQAEAILQQALLVEKAANAETGSPLLACGKALVYLSNIYTKWNHLQKAEEYALRAMDTCQKWGHVDHLMDAYLTLAEVYSILGKNPESWKLLAQAKHMLTQMTVQKSQGGMIKYQKWIEFTEARLNYIQGNWQTLDQWLGKISIRRTSDISFHTFQPACMLAENWLKQGRNAEAIDRLQALAELAHQKNWGEFELLAALLLALAYDRLGDRSKTLSLFEYCLFLGVTEGQTRIFIEKGAPVQKIIRFLRPVLEERINQPTFDPSLPELISFIDSIQLTSVEGKKLVIKTPNQERFSIGNGEWHERLSQREVEIVRLVAAGLSNDEIASNLFLSTNTIKTHLKRIYARLNTSSRLETVNKARELKII